MPSKLWSICEKSSGIPKCSQIFFYYGMVPYQSSNIAPSMHIKLRLDRDESSSLSTVEKKGARDIKIESCEVKIATPIPVQEVAPIKEETRPSPQAEEIKSLPDSNPQNSAR